MTMDSIQQILEKVLNIPDATYKAEKKAFFDYLNFKKKEREYDEQMISFKDEEDKAEFMGLIRNLHLDISDIIQMLWFSINSINSKPTVVSRLTSTRV